MKRRFALLAAAAVTGIAQAQVKAPSYTSSDGYHRVEAIGTFCLNTDGTVCTTSSGGSGSGTAATPYATSRNLYVATAGGTGYSTGDLLDRIVTSVATTGAVGSAYWINLTQGTLLSSAPSSGAYANLDSTQAILTTISGQLPTTLGQKTSAASVSMVVASDQTVPVNNAQVAGTAVATGAGTTNAGTQRVVIASDGGQATGAKQDTGNTYLGTLAGTVAAAGSPAANAATVQAAALPLPNGAATSANQTATGTGAQTMQGSAASGATDAGYPIKVGGRYNATAPTFTDGQRGDLQLTPSGGLRVGVDGGTVADNATDAGNSVKAGGVVGASTLSALTAGTRQPLLFDGYGNLRSRMVAGIYAGPAATGTQVAGIPSPTSNSASTGVPLMVLPYSWNGTNTIPVPGDANGQYMVSKGGSNLVGGQVSVGTAATLVAAARAGRQRIMVNVLAANTCTFGPSGVTTTTGLQLQPTAGATTTFNTAAAIYAVCSATTTISYAEEY